MIIILKNADFSASNIGTLSTWRITRSLGAGATYEGVTSVDKGAAFNATVTLTEGYEIGAAGVSVVMGDTVLSEAYSISGNVITITIASVTGNVTIKIPTVNTSTGEEEEPEVPDTPDIPDMPDADDAWTFSAVWEQGTLIGTKGEEDSATRIRTEYIDITHLDSLTTNFDTTKYAISTFWYDSLSSNHTSNTSGWNTENLNISADNKQSNYVRLIVKKQDDSNLTPDEANNINMNIVLNAGDIEMGTTTWMQGAISGSVSETTDATRIKTDFIPVDHLIHLTTNFDTSIYNIATYWYDEPVITALKNTPTYQAENLNITVSNRVNDYLRIVVKKSDNTTILPSEFAAINLEIKLYQDGGDQ